MLNGRSNTLYVTLHNTHNVTSFERAFSGATNLRDVNVDDTSNATDMSYMFYRCERLRSFKKPDWNTSNVNNMYGMFFRCNLIEEVDLTG